MKDPKEAYIERLHSITNLINEEQYGSCFNAAQNLTNFSWTLELKDEVFISEVLEAVFNEMDGILSAYDVPKEIREQLKTELHEKTLNVIRSYAEKSDSELYTSLKELRYIATYHQLHAWQKYPKTIRGNIPLGDRI